MKSLVVFLAILPMLALAQPLTPFTDPRDSKTYRTVKIGEQVWMADNLNYKAEGSKCYDNKPENCDKYGRLYDWQTALKVCPNGWHLPSSDEWMVLYKYLDNNYGTNNYYMDSIVIKLLKAKTGWSNGGNGTDKYGFSALPGGGLYSWGLEETFSGVGIDGQWWCKDEDCYRIIKSNYYDLWSSDAELFLFSVRCLRD